MTAQKSGRSGVLRLDLADEQAWLGGKPLRLTPKAFAVLCHLVAHRNRLVTKAELLRTLWPGTAVSDGVLTTVVRTIRRALDEPSHGLGSIHTVHRRGYRFIGAVQAPEPWIPDTGHPTSLVVGRDPEFGRLERWLQIAQEGTRQVVFITGEAGIGKTALVDAFLLRASVRRELNVARGQCVEMYGAAEAYSPWLDALGQLCRQPGSKRVVDVLRRIAPMWLAQMPALLDAGEREALQREVAGAPPERMLREMSEALEAVTAEQPLILALEDLHWGDHPSLELLASVARRREPARLLLLGTYRPVEVSLTSHPLKGIKRELQMHRRCAELPLEFLSRAAVTDYLTARFPGLPASLGPVVHRRTDGNPLFMVNLAEYLASRQLIVEIGDHWELQDEMRAVEAAVPESLRAMIDRQLDLVSADDRRLLEAASVAGVEFADAALAPALDASVEEVGKRCAALAHRGLLVRPAAEEDWADGTATRRYAFIHALYPEVLYEELPPSSRLRLHRMIGERLEAGYGPRVSEIAAALASHFERSRDVPRAVTYLAQAASNAAHRLAYVEAIRGLTRALELLEALPQGPARAQHELTLRMALAPALMITKGYATPEVDEVYARAEELCRHIGDERQFFSVLIGRSGSALLGARTEMAKDLAEQSLRLAQRRQARRYLTQAETAVGITLLWRGELAPAAAHLEQSRLTYETVTHRPPAFRLLHDPGVAGRSYAAWAQWMLGFPERARLESEAAVALAREISHPFSLSFALAFGAFVFQARREVAATREHAEAAIAVCTEHGFAMYLAVGTIFRGWALAEQGRAGDGLAVMEAGLADYAATGAVLVRPYFLALIAEVCGRRGQVKRARALVVEALASAERTGERIYEAELHRLAGELIAPRPRAAGMRSRTATAEAEARFLQALRIAREQRALSLELRVAMSLARFWQATGRAADAFTLLGDVRGRFTEGFDTPDLREAAVLLERLGRVNGGSRPARVGR